MKFGRFFEYSLHKPWKKHYLPYQGLKNYIRALCASWQARSAHAANTRGEREQETNQEDGLGSPLLSPELAVDCLPERRAFLRRLKDEIIRVDDFYKKEESKLARQLTQLVEETAALGTLYDAFSGDDGDLLATPDRTPLRFRSVENTFTDIKSLESKGASSSLPRTSANEVERQRKLHRQKKKFRAFYKSLLVVKDYVMLNYTSLRKIVKKFEKHLPIYSHTELQTSGHANMPAQLGCRRHDSTLSTSPKIINKRGASVAQSPHASTPGWFPVFIPEARHPSNSGTRPEPTSPQTCAGSPSINGVDSAGSRVVSDQTDVPELLLTLPAESPTPSSHGASDVHAVPSVVQAMQTASVHLDCTCDCETRAVAGYTWYVFNSKLLDRLIEQCERKYANHFAHGSMNEAVLQLQKVPTKVPFWDMFTLGFNVGASVFICLAGYLISTVVSSVHDPHYINVLPVMRLAFCAVLFAWLWGILVYTWKRVNLNYIYIFEFNPSTTLHFYQIFKFAAVLTTILVSLVFLWWLSLYHSSGMVLGLHGRYYILFVTIAFVLVLINPTTWCHRDSRGLLLRTTLQVVASPFSRVRFIHVYVGDVLTSMVHPLADLEYTLCYYTSGDFLQDDDDITDRCNHVRKLVLPFMCAAPYFWRAMQNMRRFWETGDLHPHITNACKYLSGITVTIMGFLYGDFSHSAGWDAGRVFWMLLFVGEVLYMYTWDVLMDWGFRPWSKQDAMLRPELIYRPRAVYYFAIISNFFARFIWALTITPIPLTNNKLHHEFLLLGLSVCEILRRFQWSFFRVENAFFNNQVRYGKHAVLKRVQEKLRSIRTIPLPRQPGPHSPMVP